MASRQAAGGWLLAHLLMLCSCVSGVGSKEESVEVTGGCLTACLPGLNQPPCHLQKARKQALQCALRETHAMCSALGESLFCMGPCLPDQMPVVAHYIHLCFHARMSDESYLAPQPGL